MDLPANPNAGYVVGSNWVNDVLIIRQGAVLSNGYGYVGFAVGANNNTAIVSGGGSVWSNSGTLTIGNSGAANQLIITNGGVASDVSAQLGRNSGSDNNTVLVSDSGSVWKTSTNLTIGRSGAGNQLIISNGGAVYGLTGILGLNSSSSGNRAVVTGSGSVWSNGAELVIGFSGGGSAGNQLIVTNGGAVYSSLCEIGLNSGSDQNSALVTGSGSVWKNSGELRVGSVGSSNQLTILNGGQVYSGIGTIGYFSHDSTVFVSGNGSVWSNSGDLVIGRYNAASQLMITNGAAVFNYNGIVGQYTASSNSVTVAGNGALWRNDGNLYVGNGGDQGGTGNQLKIGTGGSVLASNAYIGYFSPSVSNQILVSGGALSVTNTLGIGVLDVRRGTLSMSSGTVTLDSLVATNGSSGLINLQGGSLNTKSTTVSNGSILTVGNGANVAALNLASGGSGLHSFADGLTISSNGILRGVGTVAGRTTINGGGTLSPGFSSGSITFSNNLTLAPNSAFAVPLNGIAIGQYSWILTLGTVSVSNSTLSVSLGYTPTPGDSFTIISNSGPSTVFGQFLDAQGNSLTNNATFLTGATTFQINYNGDTTGHDVILTVVVPEPSTLLLVAFGVGSLISLKRRLHHLGCSSS